MIEKYKAPTLSIIVPIYNVANFLPECLDSILSQNFRDWEAILINDGSTDESGVICEKYASKDARFKVIHKKNGGLSSARNAGLNNARGKYIMFIDSDDLWSQRNLTSSLVNTMDENPEIDFATFRMVEFDEQNNRKPYGETLIDNILLNGATEIYTAFANRIFLTSACNKIFRFSNLIRSLRFPEGVYYEDERFLMELLPKCKSIIMTPLGDYLYRIRSGSITNPHAGFNLKHNKDLFLKDIHGIKFALKNKVPENIYIDYYLNAIREYKNAQILGKNQGPQLTEYTQILTNTIPSWTQLIKHTKQIGIKNIVEISIAKIFGINILTKYVNLRTTN